MTNAELLAKIKAEIERLKSNMDDIDPLAPNQKAGYLFALADVLSFLSVIEKEPEDEKKVPTRIYLGSKYEFIRRDIILKEIEGLKKNNEISDDSEYAPYELDVACGYDMACDDILSFLKAFAEVDKQSKNILAPSKECEPGLREPLESEKQMNLEKEINKFRTIFKNECDPRIIGEIASHFAQWQKEQSIKKGYLPPEMVQDLLDMQAKHIEEDMKEQMLKEAVEGKIEEVSFNNGELHNTIFFSFDEESLHVESRIWFPRCGKDGDKVRVIVLPKED